MYNLNIQDASAMVQEAKESSSYSSSVDGNKQNQGAISMYPSS